MKSAPVCLIALGLGTAPVFADVRVSNLFGDNLVLQREIAAPVWGTANPGEAVTVKIGEARATGRADAKGNWIVNLPAMKANSKAQDLAITGENTLTIRNVLVGDVWVCAGQSNMEMPLGNCNAPQDIAAANYPALRWIKPNKRSLGWPGTEVVGRWGCCAPDNAPTMTAAGFYFARRIQKETGLPLGLIDISWSGSAIEPWMPVCAFEMEPSLSNIFQSAKKPLDAYRASAEANLDALEMWIPEARKAMATPGTEIPRAPQLPADPIIDEHFPTAIYNGMVHPVTPFAIKGVIWYQGESNGGEGIENYHTKMRALIGGWRRVWQQGDFPFYFVQLANYEAVCATPAAAGPYSRNREAQLLSLRIPNTGMAVAVDIGEEKDIHPKNKFDVGERLAAWALHNDYGRKDLVPSGPLYKSMQVEEGRIRLQFDYIGAGLMIGKKDGRNPVVGDKDGRLKQFAVAGADKKWYWADAVIDGNNIIISSPQVPKPLEVRYAYDHNPAGCNLYNKDGLPASPFRTDKW